MPGIEPSIIRHASFPIAAEELAFMIVRSNDRQSPGCGNNVISLIGLNFLE